MTPSCLNCRWAEWVMTKHQPPRIRMAFNGLCKFSRPVVQAKLNSSIPAVMWACWRGRKLRNILADPHWEISPADPHTDCPTWEAK